MSSPPLTLSLAWVVLLAVASTGQVRSAGPPRRSPPATRIPPMVETTPRALPFAPVEVGMASPDATVVIRNVSFQPVTITSVARAGAASMDFPIAPGTPVPFVLGPGQTETVAVRFQPSQTGWRAAVVQVKWAEQTLSSRTGLGGHGIGPVGAELLMNAGGGRYQDGLGQEWIAEFGATGGFPFLAPGTVVGTPEQLLYRLQRVGPSFSYRIPLPDGGYQATFHFTEGMVTGFGTRVFDVLVEGTLAIDDLDVFREVGLLGALQKTHFFTLQDGVLDLDFQGESGWAMVSAIEVRGSPILVADQTQIQFGAVPIGATSQATLLLSNPASLDLTIDRLSFLLGVAGTSEAFTADVAGVPYAGSNKDITYNLDAPIPAGGTLPVLLTFAPSLEQYDECTLRLGSDGGEVDVVLQGLGGHDGHPFLHVVIADPGLIVDFDEDGIEDVVLDGSGSHTHEPGHSLTAFTWSEGGGEIASGPVALLPFAVGQHDVTLTIFDDHVPPESHSDDLLFEVHTKDSIPGVLGRYYQASSGSPVDLVSSVPPEPDFAEVLPGMSVDGPATIGGSPFVQNVMVRLEADLAVPSAGTYAFGLAGGVFRTLELDGLVVVGPVPLAAGTHRMEARFAVLTLAGLPCQVTLGVDGGPLGPIDPTWLTHDQTGLAPVINDMPSGGTSAGGDPIVIEGLAFFPSAQVTVDWGGTQLGSANFDSITPGEIRFVSPPGSGTITVRVQTPQGTSNPRSFDYDAGGPVPIVFNTASTTFVNDPTTGDWGPDGRFYVASRDGRITALEYDESYNVVSQVSYAGLSGIPNGEILGLCFDPRDSDVRIYVGHTELFAQGGGSFSGPAPYAGGVSILEGPGFDSPIPLITGLPTSNHDHGINGMVFDNRGDLLVCIGGNTNAGVIWPTLGDLPESPLSGAIVKAETSRPDFNGDVVHVLSGSGLPTDDQVFGEQSDVAPGSHVGVHASGMRNCYDLTLSTRGRLFAADNGPNIGFGPASTGPSSQGPDPWDKDEILLVERGNYYGHPNRSRGRYDWRQNVYHGTADASFPDVFTQALRALTPSVDGLAEYRSDTFQGQMRGDLLTQKWGGKAIWVELSDDGRQVTNATVLEPFTGGLDLQTGPGGAFISLNYSGDQVVAVVPSDASAIGLIVHDITPWRAPAGGGQRFVIGGVGFGSLADTAVQVGGIAATLTSVSPTRIEGIVPANPAPTTDLLDVRVWVGPLSDELSDAFRYLLPPGEEPGAWEELTKSPQALGEVAAGVVGGRLYVVGESSARTLVYDLLNGAWLPDAATRPFVGHHHTAEVVGGKLILIGGLQGGSEGKVQIYDPAADAWSLGADMPWAGGSVSTAVIAGKIYAAGGIVGSTTVASAGRYDPVGDAWTTIPPMPVGRNHTAAGTDGARLFVFGGRDGCNCVTNGFDDVMIYDPVTWTWEWDKDPGSTLAPLPQFRGGMGKAIFWDGEFYVFGGETFDGPGALPGLDVYDRVDVYDPAANAWRLDAPMLHPRHGIHPVLFQGRIFLAAGGIHSGHSDSDELDVFSRQ